MTGYESIVFIISWWWIICFSASLDIYDYYQSSIVSMNSFDYEQKKKKASLKENKL